MHALLSIIAMLAGSVAAQDLCLNASTDSYMTDAISAETLEACKCYDWACATLDYDENSTIYMDTTYGMVRGMLSYGVEQYLGIPVAADPSGDNRFKPPQEPTDWGHNYSDAYDAFYEKQCQQDGYPIAGVEDCISVDVFKPYGAMGDVPAAIWIHGGGFTMENPFFAGLTWGPMQHYNFDGLPEGGKVVTVLVHYRLGALGWMAHPGFDGYYFPAVDASHDGTSGNWGMMDSINAIYWTHSNAENLGVDTSKITVFGESAGAAHVTMLMASPYTEGMVTTFIAQSPFISYGEATYSLTARMEMDTLFTYRVGCTDTIAVPAVGSDEAAAEAACLRNASVVWLIKDAGFSYLPYSIQVKNVFDAAYDNAFKAEFFTYNSIHVWPVVDEFILPGPPLAAYSVGMNSGATMVIGHNADEYATFCYYPPFPGLFPSDPQVLGFWVCAGETQPAPLPKIPRRQPDIENQAWILAMYYLPVTATWSEIGAAVLTATESPKYKLLQMGLFYEDFTYEAHAVIQMGTDAWFANGNNQIIEALMLQDARAPGTVYHYLYAQDTDEWIPAMGACHGCELTFVLGFYEIEMTYLSSAIGMPMAPTEGSKLVGYAMNYYWASLFWTAHPNVAGSALPTWEAMSVSTETITDASSWKQTMVFQDAFPSGAMMNPCVRFSSCRTEPTQDWRGAQKDFWGGAPTAPYESMPGCSGDVPVTGVLTHFNAFPELQCTFLPCCSYTSRRQRKLLFGMPSSSPSTECDSAC